MDSLLFWTKGKRRREMIILSNQAVVIMPVVTTSFHDSLFLESKTGIIIKTMMRVVFNTKKERRRHPPHSLWSPDSLTLSSWRSLKSYEDDDERKSLSFCLGHFVSFWGNLSLGLQWMLSNKMITKTLMMTKTWIEVTFSVRPEKGVISSTQSSCDVDIKSLLSNFIDFLSSLSWLLSWFFWFWTYTCVLGLLFEVFCILLVFVRHLHSTHFFLQTHGKNSSKKEE